MAKRKKPIPTPTIIIMPFEARKCLVCSNVVPAIRHSKYCSLTCRDKWEGK